MYSFDVSASDEKLYMEICRKVGNMFMDINENECSLEDIADVFSVYYNHFAGKRIPDKWQCYEEVYQKSPEHVYLSYIVTNATYDKGRVLLFTHNFSRTGAPMILLDAAKVLMELGYAVVVISGETGDLLPLYLENGVSCIIIPGVADGDKFSKNILLRLAEGFDMLFVNTGVMGHIIEAFNGSDKKVFWWFHERKSEIEALGGLAYLPERLKDNVTAAVVSECLKDELKKDGINYKFTSLEGYVPDLKDNITRKRNKINFVICGVVCERKGYHVLLQAIDKLGVEKLKDVVFWMVGKPDDRAMVEAINLAEERYDIHYYEALSRDDVYELYKKCDCCIVPSLFEPLPLVALESLSCGCFVICSDAVGASRYFTDDLMELTYRDCNDATALADRIEYVISAQNRYDEWSRSGRFVYEKVFTWHKFKSRIAKIADDSIRGRTDRRTTIFNMKKIESVSAVEVCREKEVCLQQYFEERLLLNSRIQINELKRIQDIKDEYILWADKAIANKDEVIDWKDRTIAYKEEIISKKDEVIDSKEDKITQTEAYCDMLKKTIGDKEEKIRQTEAYCSMLEKTIEDKEDKITQTEAWAELQKKEKEQFEIEVLKLREEVNSSIYLRLKRKFNNLKDRKEE